MWLAWGLLGRLFGIVVQFPLAKVARFEEETVSDRVLEKTRGSRWGVLVEFEGRLIGGQKSFAQAHQDLFVLAMTEAREKGSYIEVGAGHPFQDSNTALLEIDFGYTGHSFEWDSDLCRLFTNCRKNPCLRADVMNFDFDEFFYQFSVAGRVEYLSVDVDENLPLLDKLPFNGWRFSVITFEHDFYRVGSEVMNKCRSFFASHGYTRVVSNVLTQGRDFEDWYVDPLAVPESVWAPYVAEKIEARSLFTSDDSGCKIG